MFDQFGEFDSYKEINILAENLFNEGDLDSLQTMAKENGLSGEVEAYLAGKLPELCDPLTALLLKWSFRHQQSIKKEILKAAGVNVGKVSLGIPGMGTAKRLIRDYYKEE